MYKEDIHMATECSMEFCKGQCTNMSVSEVFQISNVHYFWAWHCILVRALVSVSATAYNAGGGQKRPGDSGPHVPAENRNVGATRITLFSKTAVF